MSSRLLDPKKDGAYPFKYRNSASTDIAKTWAEARARIEKEQQARAAKVSEIKQLGARKK